MEAKAQAKYLKISARKVRLVINTIRGMKVDEAINKLKFTSKKAAFYINKVLKSALANALQRSKIDTNKFIIKIAYVDEGPSIKYWRARAMGRSSNIRKRSSHITIIIEGKN